MQKWNGTLLRKFDDAIDGNASVGTTVVVRNTVGNTIAVVYDVDDINSVQKNNPFVTDDFGRYSFYAPTGKYTIEFGDGSDGIEVTMSDNLDHGDLLGRFPSNGSAHNADDIGRGASTVDADLTAIELIASDLDADLLILSNKVNDEMNVLQLMKTYTKRGLSPSGQVAPSNVLGDSISYGSYGNNLFYDGWLRIVARMMKLEFGNNHYLGCCPNLFPTGAGFPYVSNDVLDVTPVINSGGWNTDSTAAIVAASYTGGTPTSTVQGSVYTIKVPPFTPRCGIWYMVRPGGGSLEIKLNGVVLTTIATANAVPQTKLYRFTPAAANNGVMTIECTKTDATINPVTVLGVYLADIDDAGAAINNFSQIGRTLRGVGEQTIQDCANNATAFILALGYNDGIINGAGQESERLIFSQRIDWVIQYCNQYNTPLIVCDFIWNWPDTSFTRQELLRCAEETNTSLHVPIPKHLSADGSVTTDSYRINTISMWADAAHPNNVGNKWIAETFAKYLGLSCTSKRDAISNADYWMPMQLEAIVKNPDGTKLNELSAYRVTQSEVQYRFALDYIGSPWPVAFHNVMLATKYWRTLPIEWVSSTTLNPTYIDEATGTVGAHTSILINGAFNLRVLTNGAVNRHIGYSSMPIKLKPEIKV